MSLFGNFTAMTGRSLFSQTATERLSCNGLDRHWKAWNTCIVILNYHIRRYYQKVINNHLLLISVKIGEPCFMLQVLCFFYSRNSLSQLYLCIIALFWFKNHNEPSLLFYFLHFFSFSNYLIKLCRKWIQKSNFVWVAYYRLLYLYIN